MLGEIIGPDILIILVIVALLFGGARLPKLARSLGSAKSEFERGLREGEEEAAKPAAKPSKAEEQVTVNKADYDAFLAERQRKATEN